MKEKLKKLIEIVMKAERMTYSDISLDMGYKKNYVSEILSPKGVVSDKFMAAFSNKYKDVLEGNMTKGIPVKDAAGNIIERLIGIESKINILFSNESEKTAKVTGKKATDVLREMNKAAQLEADNLLEELRRKAKSA